MLSNFLRHLSLTGKTRSQECRQAGLWAQPCRERMEMPRGEEVLRIPPHPANSSPIITGCLQRAAIPPPPHPTQALQMFRKSSFRVRIHLQPLGFSSQLQPLAQSLGLKGDNSGDVPQNKGRARQEGFRPPRAHPLLKILPWPLQSQRQTTQVLQH